MRLSHKYKKVEETLESESDEEENEYLHEENDNDNQNCSEDLDEYYNNLELEVDDIMKYGDNNNYYNT